MNKDAIKYVVDIEAVDGEAWYSIGTFYRKEALDFLEKYDHEGSAISLKMIDGVGVEHQELDAERVYRNLKWAD